MGSSNIIFILVLYFATWFVGSIIPGLAFFAFFQLIAYPFNFIISPFLMISFAIIAILFSTFVASLNLRVITLLSPRKRNFELTDKHLIFKEICQSFMKLNLFLVQSHFRTFFYKIQGAKIGRNVEIFGELYDPDLISLGENTIIGTGSVVSGHINERGKTIYAPIHVGKNCLIGALSLIAPGVEVGNNSDIGALTVVAKNKKIPAKHIYTSKGLISKK